MLARLLTTLLIIDENRAVLIAGKLLPTAFVATEARWAAWLVFLKSNRPHQTVFARLEEHYQLAVREVARCEQEIASELAVHLTWLAAWGVIEPQGPDSLVQQFVENASSQARHAGLDAVGRGLYRTKEAISAEAVTRLKELWQWWFDATVNRDGAFDLTAFGWWFSSSVFDPPWLISMLLRVLEATKGAVDWDHEVVKKLAELADTAPNEVVTCLARLVDRDKNNRIARCRASIRKALTTLSAGPSALSAKAIASRLVAREWPEFHDLA